LIDIKFNALFVLFFPQAAVEALANGNYNQFLDNSCDDINPNNSSNEEIDQNYEENYSHTEASNAPRKLAATT